MQKCKHDWKIIKETVIPSISDLAQEVGKGGSMTPHFVRKYVTILACEKCGKLKKFVEENYH